MLEAGFYFQREEVRLVMYLSRKGTTEEEVAREAGPAEIIVHFGALPPNRYMLDQLTCPLL